jgi:FKBP-type peptidyl-prolyl cis-trans isomerase (trigger factor)
VPWDYPKLLEELRPAAGKTVRRALLIEAIAEKEGLVPGEALVDAEVERIAESSQRPVPAVRSMLEKNGDLDRIRSSLTEKRTVDLLIERATITP